MSQRISLHSSVSGETMSSFSDHVIMLQNVGTYFNLISYVIDICRCLGLEADPDGRLWGLKPCPVHR